MDSLSLAQFEQAAESYDAAVLATPGIDRFCSTSAWVLAAREAWGAPAEPRIRRGEHGWVVLLRHPGPVRVLRGFDAMWGFASALAGPRPGALLREFAAADLQWDVLLLPGLRFGTALHEAAVRCLAPYGELRWSAPLRRWVAGLAGGVDGYLSRRSPKLRENLRRARRRATERGVRIEAGGGDAGALFDRILSVERRSWKGASGTGLLIDEMRLFYRRLADRLLPAGRLRTLFARLDGEDVGYILGGVRAGLYRGFQFSFDRRFGELSPGALLQVAQIEALAAEGVSTYDLGIDMAYKRHWGDEPIDTHTLAVLRGP